MSVAADKPTTLTLVNLQLIFGLSLTQTKGSNENLAFGVFA